MIVYRPAPETSRFRAQVPQDVYDQAPLEARDLTRPLTIHFAAADGSTDPFMAGAYWALSWSLERVFGDLLGTLLNEATLSNVETFNGEQWVPWA